MIQSIEDYWSRELGRTIEIVPRGWASTPDDYALYCDGTFMVSYKHLGEIEDYLSRYFVLKGN